MQVSTSDSMPIEMHKRVFEVRFEPVVISSGCKKFLKWFKPALFKQRTQTTWDAQGSCGPIWIPH